MIKPIRRVEFNAVKRQLRDALELASTHDPDHERRLDVIERQLERMGALQYRSAFKSSKRRRVS